MTGTETAPLSCVRADLRDIEPYRWQSGIPAGNALRFDKNVLPRSPAWWPEVAAAAAGRPAHAYPDATYASLRAAIARYAGTAPDRVVVGAGSDEIISVAALLALAPGDVALLARPTYQMYGVASRAAGARVVALDPLPSDGLQLDLPGLLARAPGARAVWLCSPNNPTGEQVPGEVVAAIAAACPGLVVVDQAYLELGGADLAGLVDRFDNLVVTRTFSKGFGLAGIRLGYAIAAPALAGALDRLRPPASVSAFAAAAGEGALTWTDVVAADCQAYAAERERLAAGMRALGLPVIGAAGNFVTVRTPWSSREAFDRLAARGLVVRTLVHEPVMDGCVRPCLNHPADDDRLLAALAAELGRPAPPPHDPGALHGVWHRRGSARRATRETTVDVLLDVDGAGAAQVGTGLGFLDHMLGALAHHGLLDLRLSCRGDLHVDAHHTAEDVMIALGEALDRALGDRAGTHRFGDARVVLDEAVADAVVDLSGRGYATIDLPLPTPDVGGLPAPLWRHALDTLARRARIGLHLSARGEDGHHVLEAATKALARALRAAVEPDPRRAGVPSTKGVL